MWIAEASSTVGLDNVAEKECERFLARLKDPAFKKDRAFAKKGIDPAVARVRSLLIQILGKKGKYDDALKQAVALVTAQPRALEPRVAECRIRHDWSLQNTDQIYPRPGGLRRAATLVGSTRLGEETAAVL